MESVQVKKLDEGDKQCMLRILQDYVVRALVQPYMSHHWHYTINICRRAHCS